MTSNNMPIDKTDDYERRQDEQRAAQRRGVEAELENVSRMLSVVLGRVQNMAAPGVMAETLDTIPGLRMWWTERQMKERRESEAAEMAKDAERQKMNAEFERLGKILGRLP